jgi:protein phosphatase PTC7
LEGIKWTFSPRLSRRFGTQVKPHYKFKFTVGSIPHPKKMPFGEDAYFIDDCGAIGVADGVGGSAMLGIDPAEYASHLMAEAQTISVRLRAANKRICPVEVLQAAYEAVSHIPGSATACIAALNGEELDVCNLGDSGCLIVRNGEVLFASKEQTHGFNFPFQLGSESMDTPLDADMTTHTITEGDLVILATDGVLDNLFQDQILDYVLSRKDRGFEGLAQGLAEAAYTVAMDRKCPSPYATRCQTMLGVAHSGGKPDDITAVIAIICKA